MALNSGSKIEVADITSALGSKIDTAGTGLSKSGTSLALASLHSAASTIGSSSAQTLAYSGTFTIPYVTRDIYGRVSGGGTRTITMPSAPSGGTATALSNFVVAYYKTCSGGSIQSALFTFPSGGTWRYAIIADSTIYKVGTTSGNSSISTNLTSQGETYGGCLIGVRIA